MTINNTNHTATLTTQHLRNLDFDSQENAVIILENDSILHLDEILRIVPGKRLVALAEWNNETVIAKLFFCKKHAKKHADREKRGADNLAHMKIPSAELKAILVNKEKTTYVLLFQYLQDADNLDTLWQHKHSIDILYPTLKQVTQELATQHVLGVMQNDLHFKNFMVTTHKVFTLDGAELTVYPNKLDKEASMRHFSLFLAQMGVGFEQLQKELFEYYAKLRGWILKDSDIHELFFLIRDINRLRWQHHQKKIFRESSQFTVIKHGEYLGVCDRLRTSKTLRKLLNNPAELFNLPHEMLKNGRSSTVIKLTIDGHTLVVKRYNIKNWAHRIKRIFTQSRAKKSWYHTQKLALFNIDLPAPIAYLERKRFGIKAECYYISDYIDGKSLSACTPREISNPVLVDNLTKLFRKLQLLESTHGDFKSSNIIVKENTPYLLDFDGTKEHLTLSSLRHVAEKDWQRFLRNFESTPDLLKLLVKPPSKQQTES